MRVAIYSIDWINVINDMAARKICNKSIETIAYFYKWSRYLFTARKLAKEAS